MRRVVFSGMTFFILVGTALAYDQEDVMRIAQAPVPAPGGATAESTAPKLTGKAAWDRLVGNSIAGKESGNDLVEYYAADGTARSMTDNRISHGRWTIAGESVCFRYSGLANQCLKLEMFGDTVTFYNEKGEGERYSILQGNPRGL